MQMESRQEVVQFTPKRIIYGQLKILKATEPTSASMTLVSMVSTPAAFFRSSDSKENTVRTANRSLHLIH